MPLFLGDSISLLSSSVSHPLKTHFMRWLLSPWNAQFADLGCNHETFTTMLTWVGYVFWLTSHGSAAFEKSEDRLDLDPGAGFHSFRLGGRWRGQRQEEAGGRRGKREVSWRGYSSGLSREAVHRVGTGRECERGVWTRGGRYVMGGGRGERYPMKLFC